MGASYDLPLVFDALQMLTEQGYKINFIVMGDGPERECFEAYAKEKNVNATFMGRLPYEKMCGALAVCDLVVNPIAHASAASIINKHADYAACGKPVLNTQESEEYRKLVTDYAMGFNCANRNAEDLAGNLKILLDNPELRRTMGENARHCAEEYFDRKQTYLLLVQTIEGVTES